MYEDQASSINLASSASAPASATATGSQDECMCTYDEYAEQQSVFKIYQQHRRCQICKGPHSMWRCELDPYARVERVKDSNMCFNCLEEGDCRAKRQCLKEMHCHVCVGTDRPKHHRALCLNPDNPEIQKFRAQQQQKQTSAKLSATVKVEFDGKGKQGKRASKTATGQEDSAKKGRVFVATEETEEEYLDQLEAALKQESKNEEEGLG